MKRFGNRFGTSASAAAAAGAASFCPDDVHAMSDAVIMASFFAVLLSLRLCAVLLMCLVILALRGAENSAEKEAEPVIVI